MENKYVVGIESPTIVPLLMPSAAMTIIITRMTAVMTVFSEDSILCSTCSDSSSIICVLISG